MVAGVRCVGRGRRTWGECVKDDMKVLALGCSLNGQYSGICGGTFIHEANLNPSLVSNPSLVF